MCEVGLGKSKQCFLAKDFVKPPDGFHSVFGVGRSYPLPDQNIYLNSGVIVPLGDHSKRNPKDFGQSWFGLENDEFVVFKEDQVNIKYLIEVKTN